MNPPLWLLLYVPFLAWAATGLGLLAAVRRAAAPVFLRLAAGFLALWAILATTTLLFVVAHGGLPAVAYLAQSPLSIFSAQDSSLWLEGALGTLLLAAAAFSLNQLIARDSLALLQPRPLEWPVGLPPLAGRVRLLTFDSSRIDAFSFTLLGRVPGPWPGLARIEVILLSSSLLERLTEAERTAVIAHELAHIHGLDTRYLTFLRTFSRLVCWDPVLAYLAASVTRRSEYRADLESVRLTGRPLALARALYKAAGASAPFPPAGATGLLGSIGARSPRLAAERIRRLVELSESGAFEPEPET